MRNVKKFLALVLAMMMTLSLMVSVNAADDGKFTDGVNDSFSEAVAVLNGMGVFEGYEDGSFKPEKTISRAEVATIVYRLATGDAEGIQEHLYKDGAKKFTDMPDDHWAAGAVGYCANNLLVLGYDETHFGPNDSVTGVQALAMILRAVGYGQAGEFKGYGWETNVYGRARSKNLLKNVDKTSYSSKLNAPATRELVAELLFQAAQIPQVTWTMLGSYNEKNDLLGTGDYNLSLGQENYGLTKVTGAVVGNDATGEAYTLLSMQAKAKFGGAGGTLNDVDIYNTVSYDHVTTNANTVTAAAPEGSVVLAFDMVTSLDLFGHKATIWFDGRSSGGSVKFGDATNTVSIPSAFGTTYAVMDGATLVKTVFANDLKTNGATASKTSVYSAAVAAGFSKSSAPAKESKIFDQFSDIAGNAATKSPVGMYRVISNSASKTADVVISLNQEVAQITQRNSTVKDGEYIYLGKGSSEFGDELSTGDSGMILDSQLSASSDKTLGDLVTANQVVGTAYGTATCDVYGTTPGATPYLAAGVAVTAAPTDAKDMLYDTQKLEAAFTGTISTYKLSKAADNTSMVKNVTLSDGKSYDLSGITGAAINETGETEWNFDSATHLVDNALVALLGSNTTAGRTYSFFLDEVGRFVGVKSSSDYGFLYATFADYEVGALGTGTIGYYIYGVNWDGQIVKTGNQLKELSLPVTAGAWAENGTATDHSGATLATGYNLLPTTKKDQGNAASGGGNRIQDGANTRMLLNSEGHLSWYNEGIQDYGNRFTSWYDGAAVSTGWSINSNDAKNGFVRVYNDKDQDSTTAAASGDNLDYLLTNSTKFIVVSGAGTSDLSVKTYNGLTELLDGGSTVEITSGFDSTGSWSQKGDNVYFLTSDQKYGNVDTDKNRTVDTVILSSSNLVRYGAQSLYFAAPGAAATGVKLASAGDASINQYKLYKNGEPGYYWVKDNAKDAATGAAVKGDFYTLVQIDTVSGQPVYRAEKVTDNSSNHVAATYNYVVVNNVNTVELACGDHSAFDGVYKVGGAVVAEAFGTNNISTVFPNGTNGIDNVEKLNNAVSMGKGGASGDLWTVSVAVVYSGIDVSCIYVTNIAAT